MLRFPVSTFRPVGSTAFVQVGSANLCFLLLAALLDFPQFLSDRRFLLSHSSPLCGLLWLLLGRLGLRGFFCLCHRGVWGVFLLLDRLAHRAAISGIRSDFWRESRRIPCIYLKPPLIYCPMPLI